MFCLAEAGYRGWFGTPARSLRSLMLGLLMVGVSPTHMRIIQSAPDEDNLYGALYISTGQHSGDVVIRWLYDIVAPRLILYMLVNPALPLVVPG